MCGTTGRKKGSMTVEASIIIPVVILSIAALIYTGLLLYQRALLQSAADTAAGAGAAAWNNRTSDIGTGKTSKAYFGRSGLYWRFFDTNEDERINRIEQYAEMLADRKGLLHPESSDIRAAITDFIVYKRLEVTVESVYRIPAGRLLRLFGADDRFTVSVKSCALIDDPAELIRNTDLIIDIERELETRYPGIKNLGEKTRGVMNELKGKIGSFLD